jgi:hypothetical protein
MVSWDPTTFLQTFLGTAGFGWIASIMAAGVIIGLIRRAWPGLRRFVNTIDALAELPEALSKLDTIQDELKVLAELRPNHGGSIRDQVTKISKTLDTHIEYCNTLTGITAPTAVTVEEPAPTATPRRRRKTVTTVTEEE